ncbi:unnamed protein product, partial [Prorocentrum cordatum]
APLRVRTDGMVYASRLLAFSSGQSHMPRASSRAPLQDFNVQCVPEVNWLHVDKTSGALRKQAVAFQDAGDAVHDSRGSQTGGLCRVTATANGTSYEAVVVAVQLRPWPHLSYRTSAVSVTLGETRRRS